MKVLAEASTAAADTGMIILGTLLAMAFFLSLLWHFRK